MAITRIQSQASTFTQPALEGQVDVVLDPGIDWLTVGGWVHMVGGGVYEIIANTMYVWTLRLKTAEAAPGAMVVSGVIYPVNRNADNEWGAKEW